MPNQISGPALAPDVGHPLVVYRKQHSLTQKGLAAQLDVARETVARWETGRRIDDDFLPMISERTGISQRELAVAHLDAAADEKLPAGSAQ